jgi:hypothetical protein
MKRWGLEFEAIGKNNCEVARLSNGVNLYYHSETDAWWIVDIIRLMDTPNMNGSNEAIIRDWLNERANR